MTEEVESLTGIVWWLSMFGSANFFFLSRGRGM